MSNINDIVTVNATINVDTFSAQNVGVTLFVTDDDTLPVSDPIATYAGLTEVGDVFSTTSKPYIAAKAYFEQSPYPEDFTIGRWIVSDTSAILTGGTLPDLSSITTISDGSISLNSTDVTGIDFTTASSYSDVASFLQTALTTAAINVTVTYNSSDTNFIIATSDTGSTATLTYGSTTGSGTDISSLFNLDSAGAVSLEQGADAQTISEAMDSFVDLDGTFHLITLDKDYKDTDTVLDLSTWVTDEAASYNNYIYFAESSDDQCLVTDDSTSTFAQLFAAGSERTTGDYTPASTTSSTLVVDNLAVSSAARLSSVDFTGINTLINPMFKNRPGFDVSILNSSEITELNRKRVNRFVKVGLSNNETLANIYQKGFCFADGIWQDVVFGVDWLIIALKLATFTLLYETARVDQTVDGQAQIKTALESVCQQGITNGLLAPGTVRDATKAQIISITGNSSFDGTLPQGYLVYPQKLSTLSDSDRDDRLIPPTYVWTKGSGAVNKIDINLFFDQ